MKVKKGWFGRLTCILVILALPLWLMYSILPSVVMNGLFVLYLMPTIIPWILHGDEQKK